MPRASSRDLTILAGSAVLVVMVSIAAVLLAPPATPLGSASTYSTTPGGAKAAFLALNRLGYAVERSFEPLADLALDPADTVLIVASPLLPASAADRAAARRFLEAGGTLLATGIAGSLLPRLQVTSVARDDALANREVTTYQAVRADPLTEGAPAVAMMREAVTGPVASPYVALFGADAAPIVLTAKIGAGRAVWWSGADPLLNTSIAAPGHVELLLNVLGPAGARRIVWSEYYHGHGRSFWSYLAGTPAPASLAQCAVVALVALATFGRRRGPIRPLMAESRTSVLEFVEALAGLYQKAGAAAGAVEISLARARRVLASASGVPAASPDDRIAAASARRLGLDAGEVSTTLRDGADAAERSALAPRAAWSIVRRLQTLASSAGAVTTQARADRAIRRSR